MSNILNRLREIQKELHIKRTVHLAQVAKLLEAEWKKTVSVPGSPKVHSRPGQPPRKVTGRFQASLSAVSDASTGVVSMRSSDPELANILEAKRPHVSPTVERTRERVLSILRQ